MLKKLMILLVVILILIVAIVIAPFAVGLPWSITRSDQSTTGVEASDPTQSVISTLPTLPVSTGKPANPTSSPTPIKELMSPSPICFAPEELLPFAFTPEAKKLMVRARSGVQIFDLESGAQKAFIHSSQIVITAALSPDGQVLAWSLDNNTIQLLRISDQKVLHTLSGHTDMVTKLRFSPDGDLLVSASHDYSVRVWNMQGEELRSLQPIEALGIGISKDRSMLATVPFDGPVALWDLDTLEKIKDLGGSGGYDTSDAEFSPDGQYLATDLANGLFLWQISDVSPLWNDLKNSMAVAFSPDGRYLAYSDVDDGNKVILDSPDGARVIRTLKGMQSPVWELFYSTDGSLLAATDSRKIHVWRVEDGALLYIGKTTCP
jgi:WD40 repeat protein